MKVVRKDRVKLPGGERVILPHRNEEIPCQPDQCKATQKVSMEGESSNSFKGEEEQVVAAVADNDLRDAPIMGNVLDVRNVLGSKFTTNRNIRSKWIGDGYARRPLEPQPQLRRRNAGCNIHPRIEAGLRLERL